MLFQSKTNLLDQVLFFLSPWRSVGGYKYNFVSAQNAYKLPLVKHVKVFFFFFMGQQYKKQYKHNFLVSLHASFMQET